MKLKSHSGMKKRVKVQKRKLLLQKSARNHLLANKSKTQKGLHSLGKVVSHANLNQVRKMLPYV